MQAIAKLNAIFATTALPLSIVMSSATVLGPLLPSTQRVVRRLVGSSTPLLSLSCPLSDHPVSSTPALSDRPASSTLASCCVVHRSIALRSVLCHPPLVVTFAAQLPQSARHPLVSRSPSSLLSHCPPAACIVSSTAPSCRDLHCPLTPHILYLDLIVAFPLLLSPPSIVEDHLLIVVCPPSPSAAAAARSLLRNLCTDLCQVVQNVLPKIAQ
jgi:hypothetical protein